MCTSGGFKLTKFLSNNKQVLQSIDEADRRLGVKDKDLMVYLPAEQASGVLWDTETDKFAFRVTLKQKLWTRRSLLSVISSIYNPLGFAAPFLLQGKLLIQQLCKENLRWDETILDNIQRQWTKWERQLKKLEKLSVDRCLRPANFGKIVDCSLHHVADACEYAYGQASYLCIVDETGRIHCCSVIGKSRVAPLKYITMPRMELVAATHSLKTSALLKRELQMNYDKEIFWTDSEVTLGYIRNESKKFKIFVANRIELIREHSEAEQWHYVNTKENPADYVSRGISMGNRDNVERWILGPKFPWESEYTWNTNTKTPAINSEDPKLKKIVHVNQIVLKTDVLSVLENHASTWSKMVRIAALMMLFVKNLKTKIKQRKMITSDEVTATQITTTMIQESRISLVKLVQQKHFKEEYKWLKLMEGKDTDSRRLNKNCRISQLDSFIEESDVIRFSGRLQNSHISDDCKHPILLPKKGKVSDLIIKHCHSKVAHGCRGITLNEIRGAGYWIVGTNSAVKKVISNCVECRRFRGREGEQKIANLPACRSKEAALFTHCGVDMFGPFTIKQRRSTVKRYGAMFKCMASRAVHNEVTCSLDTDSFMLALRSLVARRGNIRSIYSDDGSNFIGAEGEL